MEKKSIQYRIAEFKITKHFENELSQTGIKKISLPSTKINFSVTTKFDVPKNILHFMIKVVSYHKIKDKMVELFGLENICSFEIKDLNKILPIEDDKIKIPDNLMLALLNIVVSGTRGMLVAMNKNPEYASLILPVINSKDLLENIKKLSKGNAIEK